MIAVTALAGLAGAALADPAAWLSPVVLVASLLYLPLAKGPLYSLAIADAPAEETVAGGAARYARLIAVGVLTVLFLAVPGLLLSVIGLGVAYGMAYAYPGFNPMDATTWTASGPVLVGGGGVLAIGGLGILWLSARVGLAAADTVAQRRVLMLSTWPLTRGFGWKLAIARLVANIGALALAWAASWALASIAPAGWPARAAPVVGVLVLLVVRLPLMVGVLSYFYAYRSPLPVTP
jgi:hypothetical protein